MSSHLPGSSGTAGSTAPRRGWATRLYLGEAGLNVVDWRRRLFMVAAAVVLIALASIAVRGFSFGIEFVGGNAFHVPAGAGTLIEVEDAVSDAGATVVSGQEVGGGEPTYMIRTLELSSEETLAAKAEVAAALGIEAESIGDDRVSAAWGEQITRQALIALAVFIAVVIAYLSIRFEPRAAVAAISALLLDLIATAGIYSLVGFEVTPATVIGFLTIMGFDLYDTVVTFDKIHENTKGITASATETYGEAANLGVNQVLVRSINTSVVALLPVGALLFIGAGLLGAGTLKDLGLVLFVGMAVSFYTSLCFAAPLLVELKLRQPRFYAHTQRVLAKRAALATRGARQARQRRDDEPGDADQPEPVAAAPMQLVDPDLVDLAGAAPKVGSRPATSKRRRPGGPKRR
ncbi:MAG: protein translocase subunit SecF [Micromonosporaceae bacterium]|nr:protein translocase subunit SecF [Micromonosporaceae bacterium]